MSIANLVPRVAFGLVGGVLADRVSRRLVLAVCDVVRLVVVLVLALLMLSGAPPLWMLLVLVAPLGAASAAAAPAFSAILPDLVDEDELVAANGLFGSINPMALMVAGPVIGGALAAYDVGLALLVDAATFGASALCVLLLRTRVGHPAGPRPVPWAHFREGLGYVRRTPWLATNLLAGLVITFTVSGTMTMLPFLVRNGYHAPTATFGYLLAVGGVAATVAAVVVGLAPGAAPAAGGVVRDLCRRPAGHRRSRPGARAGGRCGVRGRVLRGATAGNLFQDTVLGSRVPRELRGRVSSLDWVAATAASPLSVLVAALAVDQVGIRPTYVVAGLAASLASLGGLALLLRSGEPGAAALAGGTGGGEPGAAAAHDATPAPASPRVHA